MPDNGHENITVAQAAEHFDVHPSTIQRWIQAGHFANARKRGPKRNSPYLIPIADIKLLEEELQVVVVTADDQPDPPSHQPPAADDPGIVSP